MSVTQKLTMYRRAGGELCLSLAGDWNLTGSLPSVRPIEDQFDSHSDLRCVTLNTTGLDVWDSGLLFFVTRLRDSCNDRGIVLDVSGLPVAAKKLLDVLLVSGPGQRKLRPKNESSMLVLLGNASISIGESVSGLLHFFGEAVLSLMRLLRGHARFERAELAVLIQQSGIDALPIISLISFLVGLILGFVGALQLEQFGAQVFVADLVGIATTREMSAIMVGITMAGRTGAAYAAQLAAMRVNEEIDALKSLGIQPMDYLVLPRMIALVLMTPLLCLYADLLGILGGLTVAVGVMDLSFVDYVNRTREALSLTDLAVGLVKSCVFGVLVSIAGCFHGLVAQRSASAVGAAATSAVVLSLVLIIVADGIFAAMTNFLGI